MLLSDLLRQMQTGQIAIPGGSGAPAQAMPVGGPMPTPTQGQPAPAPAQMPAQTPPAERSVFPSPASPSPSTPRASSIPQPSGFEDFMVGASGGDLISGLIGGIANMSIGPDRRQRAAAQQQQEQAKAQQQLNMTAKYLQTKLGMSPEESLTVASNPALLQPILKQQLDPMADLNRRKAEAEIKKLERETSGGGVQEARAKELQTLGIDPLSAEGKIYLITGKVPESAANVLIGNQKKQAAGPQVAKGLENIVKQVDSYDETSLESAIGPWQGADPDSTGLLSAPVANIARGLGEVWNYAFGSDNLSEIRSNLRGTTEALAAAIKPLIRGPGEGPWTDADQARLVSIVGDLPQASTKAELKKRLNNVRDRIASNFGIDVPFEALPGAGGNEAQSQTTVGAPQIERRGPRGQPLAQRDADGFLIERD